MQAKDVPEDAVNYLDQSIVASHYNKESRYNNSYENFIYAKNDKSNYLASLNNK